MTTASWRDRVFGWIGGFVFRHALAILVAAVLLAAAAVVYSASHWKFQSNRNLLISQKLAWNQWFIDIQNHFPGNADLAVVIDAGAGASVENSPAYKEARAVADEAGAALKKSPHVKEAVASAEFGPRALRLAPMALFKTEIAKVRDAGPVLESATPQALMAHISGELLKSRNQQSVDDTEMADKIHDLSHLIGAMGTVIESSPNKPVDFGALMGSGEAERKHYLASENGRLLFIRVTPRLSTENLDALQPALTDIRAILHEINLHHPGVEIGVTGIDVMEADETAAATWDSTWTTALAAVLIAVLLILAFQSWRTPMFAMIALLIGIAWAYGFLFLVIGHLQVLSVVFNIMLLGLGIAYTIYLASAFELLRHDYPDTPDGFRATLVRTFQVMGPGITIGAFATAASFATTIFTDFTGVAEMGLISSVGVLLCLAAIFLVFPSFLRLFKWSHAGITPMSDRYIHFFEERWVMPFATHPVATLVVAGGLTALSLAAVTQMRFDFDLLKLQPRNAPSVKWAERVVHDGGQPIWFSLSIAEDLAQARAKTIAFRKLPTVGAVGGIGLLFPPDDAEKVAMIQEVRKGVEAALGEAIAKPQAATQATTVPASGPASAAVEPDLFNQFIGFRGLMSFAALGNVPPKIRAALNELDHTLADVIEAGAKLPPDEKAAGVERLRESYAKWRRTTAGEIAELLDPSPLRFEDLPFELLRSYRDDRGKLALEVYPSLSKDPKYAREGVTSPLDPRFLADFVPQTQTIDPKITGVVPQIYRSGILIEHSYEVAGLLALGLVFLVVYFDYGTLHDAMLILLPVAMAFLVTFGLMWCIGMQINAANIIVLPLMFGIGVDSGVHVLNRYCQNPTDAPPGLTRGTGKGITITCLTSVISFASMTLSSHRGIASLGFVLAVGLAMTMLACWTVMPAWLELRLRYKRRHGLPIVPTR